MDEQATIVSPARLDKVYDSADHILIGDILNMIFWPLESEELDWTNVSVVG